MNEASESRLEQARPKKSQEAPENERWSELCRQVAASQVSSVRIDEDATDLRELTKSLRTCSSVSQIVINLSCLSHYRATLFSILEVLSTKASLFTFELIKVDFSISSVAVAAAVLLEAVGKNKNIRDVTIDCRGYAFPPFLKQLVPPEIPSAIAKCTHVESFWLEHMDEGLLEQLILAMRKSKHLKVMSLVPRHYSVATFQSLGLLIKRCSSLETLELHEVRFTTKRFQPVASALQSGKVKELALHHCRFTRPATVLLEGLNDKMSNSKLEKLTLGRNVKFSRPLPVVLSTALTDHRWKSLDLKYQEMGPNTTKILQILAEQTNIENLALGNIDSPSGIEMFITTVPTMKGMSTIAVDVPEHEVQRVLAAIRRNPSMESCCINSEEVLVQRPSVVEHIRDFKAKRVSDDDYQDMFAQSNGNDRSRSGDESSSHLSEA